jgi:hypothetical protein
MIRTLFGIFLGGCIGLIIGWAIFSALEIPGTWEWWDSVLIFTVGNTVLIGAALGGYLAGKDFWGKDQVRAFPDTPIPCNNV